ncbi:MAG: hypothetical protein Q9N34_10400 [Aquificota bacterium]|nr:hypothetical protein [Aquificota bacterium]
MRIRKELLSKGGRVCLPHSKGRGFDSSIREKLLSAAELIRARKVLLFCSIKG